MATETFPELAKYMLHAEQTIAAASSSAVQDAPSEPANGAPSLPFRLPYLPSPGQLVNLPKRAVLERRDTAPTISTVGWNPSDPLVGSLNELVFPAVTCLDWNFKGIDNSTAFVNAMLPYINESVIAGYLELTVSRCLSWPNLTNYDVERMSYLDFPTHLNNKVMVIGVTNDPVTPYPSALNTYNMMGPDNAVFLVHDGFGHCTISDPNNCTSGAITSFLVNGTFILPLSS
jgi:TAP-like protein